MPHDVAYQIPILDSNPQPLGRHVFHDVRSRHFALPDIPASQWVDKTWPRYVPILDQSNLQSQGIQLDGSPDALNSCTGNAAIGALGSSPAWGKLAPSLRRELRDAKRAEVWAIDTYAGATELDEWMDETYPPSDNGSSGLGAAKALQQKGLIKSYNHSFSGVNGLASALQSGPAMIGTNWYEAMFEPRPDGSVEIAGAVAGGHEYVVDAVFVALRLFRCANSWNPTWGDIGCFFLTFPQVERLLAEDGDIMQLVI